MNNIRNISMNVTDLRRNLRRSVDKPYSDGGVERRKAADRRQLLAETVQADPQGQRIWLTPGERALIEDLYLLDDK